MTLPQLFNVRDLQAREDMLKHFISMLSDGEIKTLIR